MTESSNPHFIEPVRAVDQATCRILRLIDHATAASGSRYFVARGSPSSAGRTANARGATEPSRYEAGHGGGPVASWIV
jgi:hypothetical protein